MQKKTLCVEGVPREEKMKNRRWQKGSARQQKGCHGNVFCYHDRVLEIDAIAAKTVATSHVF